MILPLLILGLSIAANLLALLALRANKVKGKKSYLLTQKIRSALADAVFRHDNTALIPLARRHPELTLRYWRDLEGVISFSAADENLVRNLFRDSPIEQGLLRRLRAKSAFNRYSAAQLLRPLVSASNLGPIIAALRRERYGYVKLALAKALISYGAVEVFDAIAGSLSECGIEYFRSVRGMLTSAGPHFIGWAHKRKDSDDPGFMIAILSGAKAHVTGWLKEYVQTKLTHDDPRVRSTAIGTAQAVYPDLLVAQLESEDMDVVLRRESVRILAQQSYPLELERFTAFLSDPVLEDVAVSSLASYVSRFPEDAERILALLHTTDDPQLRRSLSLVLAGKLPFLLISGSDPRRCLPVVESLVEAGRSAGLIAFLNGNRDPILKDLICSWLRPFLVSNRRFREECARYLDAQLREELGIVPEDAPKSEKRIPLTRANRLALAALTALVVAAPIVAIMAYLSDATIGRAWIAARESFRLFTWGFAFYAFALNCIYLALIALAERNLRSQAGYWACLDREFLFTPGILPSIAILAPAYNEEKTVVQSVYSLLALEYPDYQVIVINDGSRDNTIGVLMKEFELERIDPPMEGGVPSAPVRAVYRSPWNAKLLVIDKENGGKADALNCGINLADREYICSIDSDSLLEPDALLRMTAQILVSDVEVIAVGGNILPVNGCTVERGMLQHIALSDNRMSMFQTIEYLRSFIAGRLGWAHLNALLIISGAFGLFRRSRVLEIGGYLTGRGEFHRDTVGEDMELVVRLVKHMSNTRRKYRVRYAASANCWTEVPEDLKSLYKQRDRWHRGLVEIMTYHRGMIFNPRYGSAGLIAFPYFLVFELIGPFYEFAGYPLMLIGFATGALHWHIFAIMFSAVLLFGMFISLVSLVLSERDIVYFKRKELRKLLWHAVLENFGFRQLMGWVRVFSLIGLLIKNKGWQKLERKGFSAKAASISAKAGKA